MIEPYSESVNTTEVYPAPRLRVQKRTRASTSVPFTGDFIDDFVAVADTQPATLIMERSGYRDSEWQSKIGRGETVILPYSRSGVKYTPGSFDAVIGGEANGPRSGDSKTQYRGIFEQSTFARPFHFGTVPALTAADLKALLLTEMAAEAKTSAAQAMVTLMEGPKTFQMFGAAVGRLSAVIHAAHRALRGDPRALKQLRERMEVHGISEGLSLWLEWRYGWRILLLEIESVFDVLLELQVQIEDLLRRSRARESVGGEVHLTETLYPTFNWSPALPAPVQIILQRITRKQLYQGEALGFYTLDKHALDHKALGLHMLPTLYELIPLSFVADWFTNVGTWLQAYASIVPGMQWKGAQYSALRRTQIELRVSSAYFGNPTYGFSMGAASVATAQRYEFIRSAEDPAVPQLPQTFNGLNLERCIDAVALLNGRFGRLTSDAALWRFKLPSWS